MGSDPSALNAPAILGQTSGTTGQPKIVPHHQHLYAERLRIRAAAQARGAGKLLIATSLQFHPTLAAAIINLIIGDPVQFHPILFTPDSLTEIILSSRARTILLPPPIIRRLVHHVGPRDTPLFADLKVLRSVGGPASPEDKIAAYKHLSPGYTMAYSSNQSGMVAVLQGPDVLARPETTGRILDSVLVEALDDEGQVLPIGVPGQLRISSRTVAQTNYQQLGTTTGNVEALRTGMSMPGDVGFVDSQGFLTIQGRQDDVILRGGVNVSVEQLERMIMQCQVVEDVAAVVGSVSGDQVLRHCVATIPVEKRPRKVPSLPYSIVGKLLRRKIDPAVFD
ncbi:MAG: AMP-binding protein [Rhodobacteraceae bacterium]|nr:AMP-binding protein [Paracoccaceae bacterium]